MHACALSAGPEKLAPRLTIVPRAEACNKALAAGAVSTPEVGCPGKNLFGAFAF